jgi:hypothetical protein
VAGADRLDDRVGAAQRASSATTSTDISVTPSAARPWQTRWLASAGEETVQARVVAATNQARLAREAVAAAPRRTPWARRARTPAGRERDRSQSR